MNPLYERKRPECLNTIWEPATGLIWMRGETLFFENPRNRTLRFRKKFHLPFDPVSAELRIFADTHYQLFLNGCFCGRGPGRSDPTWTCYDRYDAVSFLQQGDNTIAALVLFQGFGTGARISIMQGLLFQLVIRGIGGETCVVASDPTWKAAPAAEFIRPTPRLHGPLGCIEVQDTRLSRPGWHLPDFDDSGWAATDYIKPDLAVTPWYHFVENPLPRREEGEVDACPRVRPAFAGFAAPEIDALGEPRPFPVADTVNPESPFPAKIPKADTPATARIVTLDFERIEAGLFRLEVEGPPGTVIDALFSDSIAPGDIIPKPEQARILAGRWILCGGRQTLEVAFNWLAFRHVQLWIWSAAPVTLHRAWVRTLYYPLPQVEGFTCSDPLLTRLDAICEHSIRLCCQDGIVDSPSREQQQWIGDARKTAVFNHHRWSDAKLHRNLVGQIGQGMDWAGSMVPRYPSGNRNVSPIPSYSLDWICIFEDLYQFTGDDSLLPEWWSNILRAIRWFSAFERDADGLLERVPHWLYIDLGDGDRRPGTGKILTTLNLQYLAALRAVAGYAKRLGDGSALAWYEGKAARLEQSIRAHLWTGRGYADARSDEWFSPGFSEVTAAHALLHLEPPGSDRAVTILAEVFRPDSAVIPSSPFSMHVVLQSLRFHSQEQSALDLIRLRYAPLLAAGATATWEHWTVSWKNPETGYPQCASSCHAWGAAPLAFFTGTILGIRPLAPGWQRVEVRPFCGDLAHASGACLLPQGLLKVRWENRDGRFTLHVTVPESDSPLQGIIAMPDGQRLALRTGAFSCAAPVTPAETCHVH
ncbi:alpha-L-rhamnosidase [Opitutaceae bacterium TAV5]|nr:alpha-L-rhamnosidase [Opitutaceae bacterium TAV5]